MPHVATFPASVALDGTGAGTVRIQNNNVSAQWVVGQVSVRTVPPIAGCTANLFQNVQLVTTSYFAGTGDNAGGDPPVYLSPGEYIDVAFSNGPANGQAIATAYYTEISR